MRIYLDHAATTPVLPAVADAVRAAMVDEFGNPSSVHSVGRQARSIVERARRQIAALIGADGEDIVFTSGGTESANLAILGAGLAAGPGGHIVTSAIEHPAVLEAMAVLAGAGFRVTYVPVDGQGLVDPDAVAAAITGETVLVSVMLANNEIGTLQPVSEIARVAKQRGVLVHTDATQGVGQIPVDVNELGVDLLTFSGHKIYAPKGIGALYIRSGVRKRLRPRQHGGGQERRLRPGTENVPGIAGFGVAAEIAAADLITRAEQERIWRNRLLEALLEGIPGAQLNGDRERRLPGNLNVSIPGVAIDTVLIQLDLAGIAASSGAACAAGSVEPSPVLLALGRSREEASQALRLSVGRSNDDEQITKAAAVIPQVIERVRSAGRFVVQR